MNKDVKTQIRKKLPPYTKFLALSKDQRDNLILLTGTGAWSRCQLQGWFPGRKVCLPYGSDPTDYDWRIVKGNDAIIFAFGQPEPLPTIARLGAELLAAGACIVLYLRDKSPTIRIDKEVI